jgi:transcriptional regulator with XRE-family HTH domain
MVVSIPRRATCAKAGAMVSERSEAAQDPERYLSALVRSLRERADPQALGIDLSGARRRRGLGLRQAEMAQLMGITETWYQKLESGSASWSERHVTAFAQILDLSAANRFVLYRLALGWLPESVRALSGVAEVQKAAIDSFAVPALLLDHVYKVRYRNPEMAELIPELVPGANWMTWILVSPIACRRLAQWEGEWAAPTLAQLRTAHALASTHLKPELDVLIDVVRLASPDLMARLWQQGVYRLTPAGETRRVRACGAPGETDCAEVSVRLGAFQPELSPGWHIYTMEPIDTPAARTRRRRSTI